ncbi:PKD domain-containing protein, partial [Runella sp.]|uniref:PKD domain-containing protein n=1 Tax=Runella sp. TaxID=1960881 RepID=UPI00301A28FE
MKRLIYSMLFLCPIVVFAQYAPFPTPGLTYGSIYNCNIYDCPDYYNTSFKFVEQIDSCGDKWAAFRASPYSTSSSAYIRAEQGKYFVLVNCSIQALYYDFSKETGDTIDTYDIGKVKVLNTGIYTFPNGYSRKMMEVKRLSASFNTPNMIWVDGVGDIERSFFRNSDFEGGYQQLICLKDSASGIFYHTTERDLDCDSLLCPIPVPRFDYICTGNTFEFTNQSLQSNSYFWDFGDGLSSSDINPEHIYAKSGCYLVTLKAKSNCLPQSYSLSKRVIVNAPNYWKKSQIPLPEPITKIQFIDQQKAWAYSTRTIWKTSDAGLHWDSVAYPGPLRSIGDMSFKDFEHGIVKILKPGSPYYSQILWTNDGTSWEIDSLEPNPSITAVERINDSVAVAALRFQGIYTTKDGGHSWIGQYPPEAGLALIFDFVPAGGDTVFFWGILQDNPYAIQSKFGYAYDAQTWQTNLLNVEGSVRQFCFINAQKGWMSNTKSIYQTKDGGLNWTPIPGSPQYISYIQFADSLHGWASGILSGIYGTTDGGQTWTQQACVRTSESLSSLNVLSPDRSYVLSKDGLLEYSAIPDTT